MSVASTTYATSALPKRALLIGINYPRIPSAKLQGCIADVISIRGMLIDAYGYSADNITVLRDDDITKLPTRQSILNALNTLAIQSAACSEIWVHYSGHGTQIADKNGDETDGKDETLVPCDFQTTGFISDDALFDIFKLFKCRVLFFSDSCHSGSIVDLQHSINYVNGTFTKSVTSKNTMANPNVIVMSGCRDAQTSADIYSSVDAQYCGAFTNSLITMLRKNNHTVDIMKVYGDVCAYLINNGYSQIPVLSSSSSNAAYSFVRAGSPMIVQVPSTAAAAVAPVATPVRPATTVASAPVATPVRPPTTVAPVRPPTTVAPVRPPTTAPVKISMTSLIAVSSGGTVYSTKLPTKKTVTGTRVSISGNMSDVIKSTVRA